MRAMDGLDAECDAITHGRCLLLGSEVNQSHACEAPIGGTWVELAAHRMVWLPHGRGLPSNRVPRRFADVQSGTLYRKTPSARRFDLVVPTYSCDRFASRKKRVAYHVAPTGFADAFAFASMHPDAGSIQEWAE